MPAWLLPAAIGAGSMLSGLFRNRSRRQTSTTRTTPTFDGPFGGIRDQIARRLTSRLGQRSQLSQGIGNQQISNINQVGSNLQTNLRNRLAASGQTGGPQDEAGTRNLDMFRGSQIIQSLNQLPLIEEQMDQDNINQGMGFMNLGRGTNSRTEGVTPGDPLAGIGEGIGDFSTFLGMMYGNGSFGGGGAGAGAAPSSGPGGWGAWQRWLAMANRRP